MVHVSARSPRDERLRRRAARSERSVARSPYCRQLVMRPTRRVNVAMTAGRTVSCQTPVRAVDGWRGVPERTRPHDGGGGRLLLLLLRQLS